MAPPLGLTFSGSAPVSFSHARTTGAKASLISTRSMSSIVIPAFFSAYAVAGIGADSIRIGSSARTERWGTRARGGGWGGEPAALDENLQPRHLFQAGVAARTLVRRHGAVRHGLALEAALV